MKTAPPIPTLSVRRLSFSHKLDADSEALPRPSDGGGPAARIHSHATSPARVNASWAVRCYLVEPERLREVGERAWSPARLAALAT